MRQRAWVDRLIGQPIAVIVDLIASFIRWHAGNSRAAHLAVISADLFTQRLARPDTDLAPVAQTQIFVREPITIVVDSVADLMPGVAGLHVALCGAVLAAHELTDDDASTVTNLARGAQAEAFISLSIAVVVDPVASFALAVSDWRAHGSPINALRRAGAAPI